MSAMYAKIRFPPSVEVLTTSHTRTVLSPPAENASFSKGWKQTLMTVPEWPNSGFPNGINSAVPFHVLAFSSQTFTAQSVPPETSKSLVTTDVFGDAPPILERERQVTPKSWASASVAMGAKCGECGSALNTMMRPVDVPTSRRLPSFEKRTDSTLASESDTSSFLEEFTK